MTEKPKSPWGGPKPQHEPEVRAKIETKAEIKARFDTRAEIEAAAGFAPVEGEKEREPYTKAIAEIDPLIEVFLDATELPDDVKATYFAEKIAQLVVKHCTTPDAVVASTALFASHTVSSARALKIHDLIMRIADPKARKR